MARIWLCLLVSAYFLAFAGAQLGFPGTKFKAEPSSAIADRCFCEVNRSGFLDGEAVTVLTYTCHRAIVDTSVLSRTFNNFENILY